MGLKNVSHFFDQIAREEFSSICGWREGSSSQDRTETFGYRTK